VRIGILGIGKIGASVAGLFARAAERRASFLARIGTDAKALGGRPIEAIGFPPAATGSLREGGRRQQSGGRSYDLAISKGEALAWVREGSA
jgi:hypothetical protein